MSLEDETYDEVAEEEEAAAMKKYFDELLDGVEITTVLNPQKYAEAQRAIEAIIGVVKKSVTQECETPEIKVEFDSLTGTVLGLDITVTEYGLLVLTKHIKEITELLPDDSKIEIVPMNDYRTLISINFYNVKEIMQEDDDSEEEFLKQDDL